MKKLILAVAIAAIFLASSMVYAGQFGPPEPAAKEGKAALGVGYFYYSAKWKPKDTTDIWKERKFTQSQTYLQLSYGLLKNWDTYLRIGGADAKVKNMLDNLNLTNIPKNLKDNLKPFGTLGVKGVFNVTPSFGIGPFFQASLYSSYKDEWTLNELGWSDNGYAKMKVKKPWEINLGISANVKVGDISLYAGPVVYWYKAKAELDYKNTTSGNGVTDSTTFKEKNNVGGFAGVRLPLGRGLILRLKGSLRADFQWAGLLPIHSK